MFLTHYSRLKSTRVISKDLNRVAIYDDDLLALQAHSDFETLKLSLGKVINAIWDLQDKHLSINLLTAKQLEDLFLRLQNFSMQKNTQFQAL